MIEHQEDPLSISQNDSEEYELLDPKNQQSVHFSNSISEFIDALNNHTAEIAIQTIYQQNQEVQLFQNKQNQEGKTADSNSKAWARIGFQKRLSKAQEISKLKQQVTKLEANLLKKENQCQQLLYAIKNLQNRHETEKIRVTALQVHLNTYGNQNTKIEEIKQEVIRFYERQLQKTSQIVESYKNQLINISSILKQNKVTIDDESQLDSAVKAYFIKQLAVKNQINQGLKQILLIISQDKLLKKKHNNPQDYIKDIKKTVENKFSQINELHKALKVSAQRIKQLEKITKNGLKF